MSSRIKRYNLPSKTSTAIRSEEKKRRLTVLLEVDGALEEESPRMVVLGLDRTIPGNEEQRHRIPNPTADRGREQILISRRHDTGPSEIGDSLSAHRPLPVRRNLPKNVSILS